MKKTIKEELATSYINEVFLSDNNLLLVAVDDSLDNISVQVRYVEKNSIKESVLKTIPRKDFIQGKVKIDINEDHSAIAISERQGRDYKLTKLYSLQDHSFSVPDFMEIEYKNMFKGKPKVNVKERGYYE